jgi:predicted NUDIX family NTP pyrophosphohydrolase
LKTSGILIYNDFEGELKILLVHPGGPYWENKKEEGWGLPKGKLELNETIWEAAIREAEEELGQVPEGTITHYLGDIKQNSKKRVYAFAMKGYVDLPIKSNECETEWPKGSGKMIMIPEISEAKWFTPKEAKPVIIKKQYEFIERLMEKL